MCWKEILWREWQVLCAVSSQDHMPLDLTCVNTDLTSQGERRQRRRQTDRQAEDGAWKKETEIRDRVSKREQFFKWDTILGWMVLFLSYVMEVYILKYINFKGPIDKLKQTEENVCLIFCCRLQFYRNLVLLMSGEIFVFTLTISFCLKPSRRINKQICSVLSTLNYTEHCYIKIINSNSRSYCILYRTVSGLCNWLNVPLLILLSNLLLWFV